MANRTCSEPDCGREHKGHGLCDTHLQRFRRASGPLQRPSMDERFWTRVDQSAGADGCWPWLGGTVPSGYGRFYVSPAVGQKLAHRVAYQLAVGPVPDGYELDHLCHTRSTECTSDDACAHRKCVNPAHLEPVTGRENRVRSYANAIAFQRNKTHCPHGHEYAVYGFNSEPNRPHRRCSLCCGRKWGKQVS